MDRPKVVIKKYENRRLYDTTNSRYINLEEVAQLLREGRDVEVVDASTGEDLTRLILTQIIVEHAKAPDSSFPIDVLRQMVIAGGRATQETALNYLRAAFDMYQNAYRVMSPPLGQIDFMRSMTPPIGRPSSIPEPPLVPKKNDTKEVNDLRRRVEELEAQVSAFGSKKKQTGSKKTSRRRP